MSIPELRKRGYPEYMIIGTLAGAATLGLMIPPSLTLIVYGVSINESITKLFMAGVIPGRYYTCHKSVSYTHLRAHET